VGEEILKRIRRAIRDKRYQMTDHALEEADADNLTLADIQAVLLHGDIEATYTDDPRGSRYVICGYVNDLQADVVCRFHRDGVLVVIITVYVVD
jgi:hypothetical protein